MEKNQSELLLATCLLAGKIMISSGSETYRVEDTVKHIAQSAGVSDEDVFTLPTGIFISDRQNSMMQQRAIFERVTNLSKIHEVNRLSRQFAEKKLTLQELNRRLKTVDQKCKSYSLGFQLLGAAVISFTMVPICTQHFNLNAMLIAAVAGLFGYYVNHSVDRLFKISFFSQLSAAFVIGMVSNFCFHNGLIAHPGDVIIGAVMPLVPGVAITNAFRDLLAGHLLTSVAHGLEALFCAAAIGTGIALAFHFGL